MRRLLHAYFSEVKYEFVRTLRTIAFAVPFLIMPLGIYLLMNMLTPASLFVKQPNIAVAMFSGICVFSVIAPGIFAVGCSLAIERDAGLMKFRRALPAPGGSTIVAKICAAMLFSVVSLIPLTVGALLLGKLTLGVGSMAAILGVSVLGSIPFSAMGLFLGAYVSGSAAPAFGNLVFLPMMWLSGLFIPLPAAVQGQMIFWPSFHLDQLALHAAGITEFARFPPLTSIGALLGVTVLFGGLAIARLSRKG
jgi:ABC-2 type transport system permease protein